MRKLSLYLGVLPVAALLAGCAGTPPAAPGAQAQLLPTRGQAVTGVVEFVERGDAVEVIARVSGLAPGAHGFHIHEKGDCSAPDAMSAGGHFNPAGAPHGHPAHGPHHAGDMPMLVADASGHATLRASLPGRRLAGVAGINGRSVIVHADPDDFRTQPTGNAGGRVACGVIATR